MKPAVAILALLLAACSGPEAYERGVSPAARPPPATYTPAGAGAPMLGQPGGPRGVRASSIPSTPSPERASRAVTRTPDGIPEKAWRRCWAEVQQCMNEVASASLLSDDDYECSRWKHLNQCGGVAASAAESGGDVAAWLRATYGEGWNLKRFGDYGNAQMGRVCADARQGHRLNAVNAKIADVCQPRWRKAFRPQS